MLGNKKNIRLNSKRSVFFALFFLSACATYTLEAITPTPPIISITPSPSNTVVLPPFTQTISFPDQKIKNTSTPTFDVSVVVSRTPHPPEACPLREHVELPDLSIDKDEIVYLFSPRDEIVLNYLNAGGNPDDLFANIRKYWQRSEVFAKNEILKDVTGDGVPEILIIPSELYIFGCHNGQYHRLLMVQNDSAGINSTALQLVGIQDMNLNGVPEIIIARFGCGGFGAATCLDVFVYEWDGNKFTYLLPTWSTHGFDVSLVGGRLKEYLPDVSIRDIDDNGTFELILTGGVTTEWYLEYFSNYPWRDKSDIYMWNGEFFSFHKTEFSPPKYRYQAVQDGDRAMLNGEYEEALAFYQKTIFDDSLLGWSPAHREHYTSLHQYIWNPDFKLTPTPVVPEDAPQERSILSSYSHFRIMLLYTLQGNLQEAEVTHQILLGKYPDGYVFARLANTFWEEYKTSRDIGKACASAVSIINNHSDILEYLGGKSHNFFHDAIYEPKDICPFE